MRLADYLIEYLYGKGVKTIFTGSGGGIMYLTDALKKNGKMKYVCLHHEQAVGYAAVGYAKYTNTPAVCLFTTGCGGTNVMTPLLVANQDYVPVIFIQGQTDEKYIDVSQRKFGVQGMDSKTMVSGLAKHIVVRNKEDIEGILEHSREYPVWLEIPLFRQCQEI